jgi:hypothetical protein
MKVLPLPVPLRSLLAYLLLGVPVLTQAEPPVVAAYTSFEEVIKLIPGEVLKGFKRSSEMEAARRSSNDILVEKAVGKMMTFKVELGERSSWAGDGSADKFQVAIKEIEMKESGVVFTVRLWVMLPIEDEGILNDLRPGDEVKVTGKLTRFEFTTSGAKIFLSGDLRGARITDH